MSIEDKTPEDKKADTEEELVPVETPPEDNSDDEDDGVVRSARSDADEDDDLDDDDDSDDDDDGDGKTSHNRKRRQKRREMQRRAKEAAQNELRQLRAQNAQYEDRLKRLEGYTANSTAMTLEQQAQAAVQEVRQAEHIIARATEAGKGDDVVAAMRIRDAAADRARQLEAQRAQYSQQQNPAPQQQRNDPVVNYASQWVAANKWYDPNGTDETSQLTKQIDAEVMRDGFNPASREYWQELTTRLNDAFTDGNSKATGSQKKKAPPTNSKRNHAPASTRKEIYVTPERKQAMIDAGIWDNPSERQRYLKAYQDYDNSNADR